MVVCISLEEVLPRPKAGLLSRMLRLADVSLVSSPNTLQPVYLLHPGGEYHLGVTLFHPPAGQRVPVGGAAWVRVAVSDGQAVTMDIEQDQGSLLLQHVEVLQYVEVPLSGRLPAFFHIRLQESATPHLPLQGQMVLANSDSNSCSSLKVAASCVRALEGLHFCSS